MITLWITSAPGVSLQLLATAFVRAVTLSVRLRIPLGFLPVRVTRGRRVVAVGRAERTAANGGVIPSNVGLDGTIGGEADGKWWGGAYGWGFNCVVPQTGVRVWRSAFGTHAAMGFGNAILLTGDVDRYASVWRGDLDKVNANTKKGEDGQILYPHVYGAFPGDTPKASYRSIDIVCGCTGSSA